MCDGRPICGPIYRRESDLEAAARRIATQPGWQTAVATRTPFRLRAHGALRRLIRR